MKHNRRTIMPAILVASIAAAPTVAVAQSDDSTKRVFGQLLGAGVGALIGSKVGGGKGKLAAVAVGALAGAWLGGKAADRLTASDRQGIAQTTNAALQTGQSQTWVNPDTGVRTSVSVKDTDVTPPPRSDWSPPAPAPAPASLGESPPLDYVNARYIATKTSNVRAGPGTEHEVVGTLREGEQVTVVGAVQTADWLMVSTRGVGSGFVYASLLRPVSGAADDNPLRAELEPAPAPASRSYANDQPDCTLINQEIVLPDGTRESRDIRACRRPDGTWEAVS